MDKMKRQAAEDKQNLMQEAGKQMRDAVATVRADMESHIAQAQAMGVKEALKESNFQSSSKEVRTVCVCVCVCVYRLDLEVLSVSNFQTTESVLVMCMCSSHDKYRLTKCFKNTLQSLHTFFSHRL